MEKLLNKLILKDKYKLVQLQIQLQKMKKSDGTIYYVDPSFDGQPITAESCGPSPVPGGVFACGIKGLESPYCDPTTPQGKIYATWSKCNSLVQSVYRTN